MKTRTSEGKALREDVRQTTTRIADDPPGGLPWISVCERGAEIASMPTTMVAGVRMYSIFSLASPDDVAAPRGSIAVREKRVKLPPTSVGQGATFRARRAKAEIHGGH